MRNPQRTRTAVVLGATALMIPSLVSCSSLSSSSSSVTVTETASFTTTVTEAPEAATAPAAAAPTGADHGEVPCAASSYTPDAEKDLVDEGVTKEEVDEVLRQGCTAAKWDNDGYWEIEWGDIEVEIYPDGTVRDVDR